MSRWSWTARRGLRRLAIHMNHREFDPITTRKDFLGSLLGTAVTRASLQAAQQSNPGSGAGSSAGRKAARSRRSGSFSDRKTDVWTHILPRAYINRLNAMTPGPLTPVVSLLTGIHALCDIDVRFRAMDVFGNYRQVLTLVPFVHLGVALGDPETGRELVRIGNDGIAEVVLKHPDRFAGFAASLPMHDPDQALVELDRVTKELGALGVQIETNVNGLPLDDARFEPLFARIASIEKPIWIHPARSLSMSDYSAEKVSKYPLAQALGWPYETAVCLARLIFAGHLERYPKVKILAHHGGGMIPQFAGRLGSFLEYWGPRFDPAFKESLQRLSKPLVEYFKMLYVDTALFESPHSIGCVLAFFGLEHVLFGTDTPFDPEGGDFIGDAITGIDALHPEKRARKQIYQENAVRVLGIK